MQTGTGYTAISAGSGRPFLNHNVALKSDGSLWAWGENESGQLGNGTTTNSLIPKQISSGYAVIPTTPTSYQDLWWNQNESGWGVALSQQYSMIFAAWYTYNATGKAIWYVASSCPVVGSGCTGDLYQVTGGTAVTSVWDGSNKVVTKVGSVTFAFTDASNGTMNYSINGAAGNRVITREGF